MTPYMYSTYEGGLFGEPESEAAPTRRKKIVILGGGPEPYRAGHRVRLLLLPRLLRARATRGYETIMVNCNPETVSTDYDTSDRLYFEPLTAEDVLEMLQAEKANGRWSA
jgi:carbamoyl-phosphate synthase large subunit